MRILDVQPEPFYELRYRNARRGGGTCVEHLPFQRGRVADLPGPLEGLFVVSDLQGRSFDGALLGVELARQFEMLALAQEVPDPGRVGLVVAGDLYAAPAADHRGASGDVSEAWTAFARTFRWAVGVLGNHDLRAKVRAGNAHVLDGDLVELDGLRFAGVSGIPAEARKLHKGGRRLREEWLALIELGLLEAPDVLVVHEGPRGDRRQVGDPDVNDILDAYGPVDVVRGHKHWARARADLPGGARVLNSDHRAVLLQ